MVRVPVKVPVLSQAITKTQAIVGIQAISKRRRDVVGFVNSDIKQQTS
jgi:hypothetical protein